MAYGLPVGTDSVSAAILTKISDSLEALRKNEPGFVTTGGSANAYTATFAPAHALATDFVGYLRIHATNTGASTLNVNGTGAKNLMKIQGASFVGLAPSDVIANGIYQVIRDQTGDRYLLLSRVGQVTVPDMKRIEASAENSALVTVTASSTVLVTLALGQLKTGDRILISADLDIDKGATAGQTTPRIFHTASTSLVTFFNSNTTGVFGEFYHPAGESAHISMFAIAKIVGDVNLTLEFRCQSAGSDSTVSTGRAQIHALGLIGG